MALHAIPSRWWELPGFTDPLIERFAADLATTTRGHGRPRGDAPIKVWESEEDEVREAFRERAMRFIAGDMSVAAWSLNPPE